jgi:hypothetical protein
VWINTDTQVANEPKPLSSEYYRAYSCFLYYDSEKECRCLATANKHVNNTDAIARQLLGKRVPVATDTDVTVKVLLDYKNGKGVFYVFFAD